MKLSPAFIATLALSFGLSVANLAASSIQLSELDLSLAEQQPKVIKPTAKTTMANVIYTNGYITHGTNDLYLSLDGKVAQFDAIIGIVDNPRYKEGASVRFEVIGDNRYLYVSDPIHPGEEGKLISVNTTGVKTLILVTHGVDKIDTLAMWANASFAFTGKAPVTISRTVEKPYVLTPPSPETPKINGASITGVRPTHPFLFKIPVTGKKPIEYSAKNLPAGLSLDSKTGIISGSIQNKGDYVVTLGAKNALGSAERELTIRVGDMLALTPQMGWNSWNCFASAVTAEDMKGAAEAFVKTGLIDHGWTYVNVDDYW